MNLLKKIFTKASGSRFYLWVLNMLLWRLIPFNKSHRVKIVSITSNHLLVRLPYKKANLNHLRSMHACALATLCEYTCGMGLITRLDPEAYRLILKEIRLDYHAQGKGDVTASFGLDNHTLQHDIIAPLERDGVLMKTFFVHAYDSRQKLICSAEVTWQLKSWKKVNRN